ncbi:unnamed protein product, partial [Prorocentrum cordatum]
PKAQSRRNMNHRTIGDIDRANDMARSLHVQEMEKPIKFGSAPGNNSRYDVEADEVDLGKNVVDDGCPSPHDAASTWEQRGPGPIRENDWEKFAQKHLQNRNVILHTGGARAYKLKEVPGMIHDGVAHMKKKLKSRKMKPVKRNGKFAWILPKYAKEPKHNIPGTKRTLKCRGGGGTQVVDRFWQLLRSYLKCRSGAVGSASLRHRVRSAQWAHWHRADDAWSKTGEMLKHLNK